MSIKNSVLGFVFYCLILLYPAWGWGQSVNRVDGGNIVHWNTDMIPFIVDVESFRESPVSDPVRWVTQAAHAWEVASPNAPRFQIKAGDTGPIGYHDDSDNNQHGIRFYRHGFPRACIGRQVLALTLLTRNSKTGEVVDADIIFDGERNRFTILGESMLGVPGALYDFPNVVTHEFGHALGLVEDPGHADATMFPSSQPGEIAKRDLGPSDIASITETYASGPAPSPREPGASLTCTVVLSVCLFICITALIFVIYAFFIRKNRSAATTTAFYVVSALLLVLGYPRVQPQTTEHGLVVSTRSFWRGGIIHTHAMVQTAHGLERVKRLGGQIGNYRQEVLDAPSGDQLIAGTRVPLHK